MCLSSWSRSCRPARPRATRLPTLSTTTPRSWTTPSCCWAFGGSVTGIIGGRRGSYATAMPATASNHQGEVEGSSSASCYRPRRDAQQAASWQPGAADPDQRDAWTCARLSRVYVRHVAREDGREVAPFTDAALLRWKHAAHDGLVRRKPATAAAAVPSAALPAPAGVPARNPTPFMRQQRVEQQQSLDHYTNFPVYAGPSSGTSSSPAPAPGPTGSNTTGGVVWDTLDPTSGQAVVSPGPLNLSAFSTDMNFSGLSGLVRSLQSPDMNNNQGKYPQSLDTPPPPPNDDQQWTVEININMLPKLLVIFFDILKL